MKVVYVVNSITELNNKINLLKMKFGDNLCFVVRADLADLFKTFGYQAHAIYYNNLTKIIHNLLKSCEIEDVVICYSSLKLNNSILNKFTNSIGNKSKVVSVLPRYNTYEQVCNSVYNVYVKSLFKTKDSMVSSKLQFIPKDVLKELLSSHLGNRLFEIPSEINKTITIEDEEINKSLKTKSPSIKYNLIALVIALCITAGLLISIAYLKVNYIIILISSILYILDIMLTVIFLCKAKFDRRFLK